MSVEDWFPKSREAIKNVFGDDADLFCRLLAGTSPISTIEANVVISIRLYRQIRWFGTISRDGLLGVHYISTNKLLNNPKGAGRKVWSLYQNLIGNENVCPIDRWMKKYFGLPPEKYISDKEYDRLEDLIRKEATQLNITPAQRQVQIWCESRLSGSTRATLSYGDIIKWREITKDGILARLL